MCDSCITQQSFLNVSGHGEHTTGPVRRTHSNHLWRQELRQGLCRKPVIRENEWSLIFHSKCQQAFG